MQDRQLRRLQELAGIRKRDLELEAAELEEAEIDRRTKTVLMRMRKMLSSAEKQISDARSALDKYEKNPARMEPQLDNARDAAEQLMSISKRLPGFLYQLGPQYD